MAKVGKKKSEDSQPKNSAPESKLRVYLKTLSLGPQKDKKDRVATQKTH
jgi:hypothetical protein